MQLSRLFLGLLVLTQFAEAVTKHETGTAGSTASGSTARETAPGGTLPPNITQLISTVTPYNAASPRGKAIIDHNFPKPWEDYKNAPQPEKIKAAAPFVALVLSTNETPVWQQLIPQLKAEQERICKTDDKPGCAGATWAKIGGEIVAGVDYKYDDTTNKDVNAAQKEEFKKALLPELAKVNETNAKKIAAAEEFSKTGNISEENKKSLGDIVAGAGMAAAKCKTDNCTDIMAKVVAATTHLDGSQNIAHADFKNGKNEIGRLYMTAFNRSNPGQLAKDIKALMAQAGPEKLKEWVFSANKLGPTAQINLALNQDLIKNFKYPEQAGLASTQPQPPQPQQPNNQLNSNASASTPSASQLIRQVNCTACHGPRQGGPTTARAMVAMIDKDPTKRTSFLNQANNANIYAQLQSLMSQGL